MNIPVFDLHCDTVTELLGQDLAAITSLRRNTLHIDLERLKKYPAYVLVYHGPSFAQGHEAGGYFLAGG